MTEWLSFNSDLRFFKKNAKQIIKINRTDWYRKTLWYPWTPSFCAKITPMRAAPVSCPRLIKIVSIPWVTALSTIDVSLSIIYLSELPERTDNPKPINAPEE